MSNAFHILSAALVLQLYSAYAGIDDASLTFGPVEGMCIGDRTFACFKI